MLVLFFHTGLSGFTYIHMSRDVFMIVPFTFPDVFNNSWLLFPAVTVVLYPQHIPLRDNQAHFITKERKSHIYLM